MLNTSVTYNPTNNVKVSAVSGTIIKTNAKSFFTYAQFGSSLAKNILQDTAKYYGTPVVVLQAMCAHDDYMIYELMTKKDYEEAIEAELRMRDAE